MDVKSRMANLGITQVDMLFALRERGEKIQPPMLSSILSGVYTSPKANRVLSECEAILQELENERIR